MPEAVRHGKQRGPMSRAAKVLRRSTLGNAEPCDASDRGFGFMLGVVFRSYADAADEAIEEVPGGRRGYQVLVGAIRDTPDSQAALAFAFAGERAGHPVHQPTRHVTDLALAVEQQCQQQPGHAGSQVQRPHHLPADRLGVSDQRLDRGLPVGHRLAEHHLPVRIDRTRVMRGLADIDTDPDLVPDLHPARPPRCSTSPRGRPASRSINSDHAHRFQSAARASTTTGRPLLRSHPAARNDQPHPVALGI
jgi:hypothetical protein